MATGPNTSCGIRLLRILKKFQNQNKQICSLKTEYKKLPAFSYVLRIMSIFNQCFINT